jgi:hypothetical protein
MAQLRQGAGGVCALLSLRAGGIMKASWGAAARHGHEVCRHEDGPARSFHKAPYQQSAFIVVPNGTYFMRICSRADPQMIFLRRKGSGHFHAHAQHMDQRRI